eukprot:TRINITY_DN39938_c0_g1_i1.p2 TRINITY_DN39938_c0_g1~~TRINITY_DN39938_c0_g1_i1.p2  ORF type:complete len:284 (+),score=138.26 TRINITY_DN39938_c0_g1_i1:48-854(+)
MMRRAAINVARSGVRFQSTPAWVKPDYLTIFQSNFADAQYPEHVLGGDHLMFSKLMYQLAIKENKGDVYLKNLEALLLNSAQGKFGPHWTVSTNVAEDKQFAELEAGVRFVLRWMQATSQMDKLEEVARIFQVYIKAAKKTIVVPVTLSGLPESNAKQAEAARKAAQATVAARLPEKKDWALEFHYLVDPGILDGWRVEVASLVVEDMSAYLERRSKAEEESTAADFTSGPKEVSATTTWEQNPETELLGDWVDELSLYDAEEARAGF